jgi:putative FmdB family regulatory protein
MPIYAYKCASCGHQQDVLQKMSDQPLTVCPQCNQASYAKQVTAAGFQLKGSGWYVTDFRDNGAKKASKDADKSATAEKPADATTPAAADSKTPAASTDAKSGGKTDSVASTSTSSSAGTSSTSTGSTSTSTATGATSSGGKQPAP